MVVREKTIRTEDNLGDNSDDIIPFKYTITSYGADYPVDGLVKRIKDGSIFVPRFQRGFVWSLKTASRFVESLLLGLPVPGIFLAKEQDTQKLLVIDGQQRLRTLQYFYEGIFARSGREFALADVQTQFKGITYKTLNDEDRRRLDDSIIHATVVKQDEPSEDDKSSIYYIFERLNTGGQLLQPQEIRTAIYRGEFCDLLRKLNETQWWREIYGPVSKNMKDQELILRFFAFYFNGTKYAKPLKEFLNKYMGKNRHLNLQSEDQLSKTFSSAIEIAYKCLGNRAFKPKGALNVAVFDAVMVGIARRLSKGTTKQATALREQYENLLSNAEFVKATEAATTDEESVRKRMKLATEAFANVE